MTVPDLASDDVAQDSTSGAVDVPPAVTPRRHAIGLALVSLVAFIWVGSAELIQYIFGESHFAKPYFLTYLSTSLFSVYLLGFLTTPSWRALRDAADCPTDEDYTQLVNDSADDPEGGAALSAPALYSVAQIRRVAMILAPLFFLSNYFFNVGLGATTVASSSTISTLSALFSLILGAMAGVERFSLAKLGSSLLTIAGVAIISTRDEKDGGQESLWGDLISVFAALMYSVYTIELKKHMPSEKVGSMAMMFGYVGAYIAIIGWPVIVALHFVGVERFAIPNLRVVGLLLVNALIGTVLSDYLWAKSVTYTTPLIATLALSLTLPMSLLFDYFLRSLRFTGVYYAGVGFVLVGFVAANLDEALVAFRTS